MMQFADRYIQSAKMIVDVYDGALPLQHHLKHFFSTNKKYGSKDRKAIIHACYCYYRLGNSLPAVSIEEKIKAGIFLCTHSENGWGSVFTNEWVENWSDDLSKRIEFVSACYALDVHEIFPLHQHLSDTIDKNEFLLSHLIQPDLFIRTRPGKNKKVADVLKNAGLDFEQRSDNCIALPNATKIDQLIELNKDAVVQDHSSQRIAEFLSDIGHEKRSLKVWDCCAASGGKSILAVDVLRNIELTVSDIRSSILRNLSTRLREAGVQRYRSSVIDLSVVGSKELYDLVICDVPCSGSGTWSRTPEQLHFFKQESIAHYIDLQQKITKNVIPSVSANGYLLYITCSVLKEENEEMVKYILANSTLQLKKQESLKGYDKKADTMFAALFTASPL